jgi:hypothetical protein
MFEKFHNKTFAALGLLVTACSVASAGEIADLYAKAPQKPTQTNLSSRATSNVGVSEIGLERTACYGMCPVYNVVIKSDGTVRYKGESNVKMKGERTGSVSPVKFNNVARFIKENGYMNLGGNYTVGVTDNPTVFTTVVMNGKRKVIRNYANAGPNKLWVIEQLIDKLLLDTDWDVIKPAQPRR